MLHREIETKKLNHLEEDKVQDPLQKPNLGHVDQRKFEYKYPENKESPEHSKSKESDLISDSSMERSCS